MQAQLNLFEEEGYEYFFLIQPDAKLDREVRSYKRLLNEKITLSDDNLYAVPHLSLFKWQVNTSMDQYIIQKTTEALHSLGGFMIRLGGVDVFTHGPEKRSLVLKVDNAETVKGLSRSLIHTFKFREHNWQPHITIARSIPTADFNKLNYKFNQFNYKGEFYCDRVVILKKPMGEGKKYVLLHEARLQGQMLKVA